MKRYGRSMLSEDQVKWIVNAKLKGKLTNREIASVQGVSTRRVQQLYSEYKSTEVIRVQKKAGRHKQPLPEQVKYETKCPESRNLFMSPISLRMNRAE